MSSLEGCERLALMRTAFLIGTTEQTLLENVALMTAAFGSPVSQLFILAYQLTIPRSLHSSV